MESDGKHQTKKTASLSGVTVSKHRCPFVVFSPNSKGTKFGMLKNSNHETCLPELVFQVLLLFVLPTNTLSEVCNCVLINFLKQQYTYV